MRIHVALAALLAAAPPAVASHAPPGPTCGSDGYPALGVITLGAEPLGTWYVDDRNYLLGNGIWIYQESNDVEGLQRGGYSPYGPSEDYCYDDPHVEPDILVF